MAQHRRNIQAQSALGSVVREIGIERIGAQGDGVAAGPLFAPLTLPGERVSVRTSGDRAELVEILQASPDRVAPPCPHFGLCGGCALQHWAATPYLAWKVDLIAGELARQGLTTEMLPVFASPPGSRRRIALHARPGTPREARLGYKARGSWRLVDIEVCPIADPRLQEAFPALRHIAAPFLEHPKSAPTLHVTWTDAGLDIDVTGVERRSSGLSADRRMRAAEASAEANAARVTLAGEILYQARQPVVRLGQAIVALPPGAFLQATREAEAAMTDFTLDAVAGSSRVADLFCGVGTFALRLAEIAQVRAADSSQDCAAALTAAVGGAPGLKGVTAEARDLFRRPMLAQEMKNLDAVVFDPPRAGAPAQAAEIASSKVSRAVGVSCNPASFARDARILVDAGFRLERVLPVDQFLWSPHVELVGVFGR